MGTIAEVLSEIKKLKEKKKKTCIPTTFFIPTFISR